eukprot:CAMPEP_0117669730 /NCGR_PEP_ID=MMETSP0804-20121206/12310_1 /TAXON_ID=1074897 /ORGANISM="Tetraselmis astigmatica, Strain CCMP880" /LENGTH=143 /DNA_ID=CAMNT_0005477851 /DNA_START=502 /DNA_END=934 /DNA_ORIENTATION=+
MSKVPANWLTCRHCVAVSSVSPGFTDGVDTCRGALEDPLRDPLALRTLSAHAPLHPPLNVPNALQNIAGWESASPCSGQVQYLFALLVQLLLRCPLVVVAQEEVTAAARGCTSSFTSSPFWTPSSSGLLGWSSGTSQKFSCSK